MSAKLCFHYHKRAKDLLLALDADVGRAAATDHGAIPTFATLCLQSLSDRKVAGLGDFAQVLRRLVQRSARATPGKPMWVVEAEVVLHLSERLLGQAQGGATGAASPLAISTHRTRRRSCGTYSTPDHIVDDLCRSVIAKLNEGNRGSKPRTVVDLSAEAGHFVLGTIATPDRPAIDFLALDRDPEAMALLRALMDHVRVSAAPPDFRLRSWIADSIMEGPPDLEPGAIDAVIGNPPWKTMHPTDEEAYVDRYGAFLRGRFDVYQAFLLRADELLRPGGVLGAVLPSSFLYTDNAKEVRRYLIGNYEPLKLSIYPRRTFVELPSVTPIAFLFQKKKAHRRTRQPLQVSVYRSRDEAAAPAQSFPIDTDRSWSTDGRAVFPIANIDPETLAIPSRSPGKALSDLGFFSSGAKLSSTKKIATDAEFHAVSARAVRPFFVDLSAASRYCKGAPAFERVPRTDLIANSKVIFQTLRCVSMPRRLVAAAAAAGELACSTAAMLVPYDPRHTDFLAGLLNASFVNAWYKARDHHHTIKMSVLKELLIPPDDELWAQIGRLSQQIAGAKRRIHARGEDPTGSTMEHRCVIDRAGALDALVFDLYEVPARSREALTSFSALGCLS